MNRPSSIYCQTTHNATHNGTFICYSFTGKERDEETGYGYFGARYMDHELMSGWLSVDPMADKYPSISPYAYCAWNPIKLVDPDGREINPIYDLNGIFLGTDDTGLKGEAYFMNRSDFSQNMSHDKAMELNKGETALLNNDAKTKYNKHYTELPKRPDYDGYITLKEANDWYRHGNGISLYADLTKIDLSSFRSLGDSKIGKKVAGEGKDFDIYFYGTATLKKSLLSFFNQNNR